jgi:hypothetical protein
MKPVLDDNKTENLMVLMTPQQKRDVKEAARKTKVSMSEYARIAINEKLKGEKRG